MIPGFILAVGIEASAGPTSPELVVQSGHRSAVNAVAFSPDAAALATGGVDGTVLVWETSTGRQLRTLRPGVGTVRGLFWLSGLRGLAAAGESGRTAERLRVSGARMSGFAVPSPASGRLGAVSSDGSVELWDRDGELLREAGGGLGWI